MELFGFKFWGLGGDNELQLYANSVSRAQELAQLAIEETLRIERKYSAFLEESVISEICRSSGKYSVELDDETASLIDYAAICFEQSEGLFDITSGPLIKLWDFKRKVIPNQSGIDLAKRVCGFKKLQRVNRNLIHLSIEGMEINLGGLGKEYAVDRAATLLSKNGITNGLINFGGDLRAVGPHLDGSPWQIGVAHPRKIGSVLCTMPLSYGGFASSGDYERFFEIGGKRYCHIINPLTGYPVNGLQSVTVIADNCLSAGTLSTIAMLVGEEQAREILEDQTYLMVDGLGEQLFGGFR